MGHLSALITSLRDIYILKWKPWYSPMVLIPRSIQTRTCGPLNLGLVLAIQTELMGNHYYRKLPPSRYYLALIRWVYVLLLELDQQKPYIWLSGEFKYIDPWPYSCHTYAWSPRTLAVLNQLLSIVYFPVLWPLASSKQWYVHACTFLPSTACVHYRHGNSSDVRSLVH